MNEEVRKALRELENEAIAAAVEVIFDHINSLEKKLMATDEQVAVNAADLADLRAKVAALQPVVDKLVSDNSGLLDLVVNLRAALATALASGQPLTVVDVKAAVASIDSVTKELSDATTTDDAVLNPPPPVVAPPVAPVDPGATIVAGTDLNPNPGAAAGLVGDSPGNPPPAQDMAVIQHVDGSVTQTTAAAAQATIDAAVDAGNPPPAGFVVPAGSQG